MAALRWSGLLLLLYVFCLSCSLMKKKASSASEHSTTTASHESAAVKQTSTGRETQRYTYWNDSVLYQYEVVKEKVKELEQAREVSGLKQENKVQVVEKTSVPDWKWVAGLVIAFCFAGYIAMMRFVRR